MGSRFCGGVCSHGRIRKTGECAVGPRAAKCEVSPGSGTTFSSSATSVLWMLADSKAAASTS
eukprot:355984-Chlamydomonas_euryale.AAC.1